MSRWWSASEREHRRTRLWRAVAALVVVVGTLATQAGVSQGAWATGRVVPSLTVSPTSGLAGRTVTLTGDGFIPKKGILWDGAVQDTFTDDGPFSKSFIIPPGASAGLHTIEVCSWQVTACFTEEFEEKAAANFTVTAATPVPPTAPSNNVDYSLIALEVTQGVRGNVPVHPEGGRAILPADDAAHVANRRTVVRAYPRVSVDGGTIRPVTAYLEVLLPDSPGLLPGGRHYPNTRFLRPAVDRTLDTMRRNEAMSFNFILPDMFVREGSISIRVVINPLGAEHSPECILCPANNATELRDVRFVLTQTEPIDFRIHVADFAYYDASGNVVKFQPSPSELAAALNYMIKTWPIDPALLRVSYRYTKISQQPGDPPPPVEPPIPGYPPWASVDHADENQDLFGPTVTTRNPYVYVWLAFDDDSHKGCSGGAGTGPNASPLFHAGTCGPTLAQEAAHTLDLGHAGNAHGEQAGGGFDPRYPGAHGQVEAQSYGFDVWDLRAVPPDTPTGHRHDFMSYGGAPEWVSVYTWEKVASSFTSGINAGTFAPAALPASTTPTAFPSAAATEYLRVSGTIRNETSVHLDPVFTVTAPTSGTEGAGDYKLTLRDSAGTALVDRTFEPRDTSQRGVQEFYELVPAVGGLARLEISRNGQLIGVKTASSRPPTVRISSPATGDRWGSVGETTVTWEGGDPDGDPLTYRVQASADGQRWYTIHGATSQTQALIYLADVPGSGQGWRVRVQANDGLNVASAEVGGLSIDPKPPIPTILSPLDHRFIGAGGSLDTLGQGYDVQDGALPPSGLQWLLDGQPLGAGTSVSTANLTTGEHKLALRATNNAGLTGTTEVTIVVGEDKDGDRTPDSWEAQVGLNPGDPEDAAGDLDADRIPNWQEYDLGSDPNNPRDPALRSSHEFVVHPAGDVLPTTAGGGAPPVGLLVAGGVLALLIILVGAGFLWRRRRARGQPSIAVTEPMG